ncbi:MAG: hypothetical protein AAGA54_35115 [Myxococcota bacterium]
MKRIVFALVASSLAAGCGASPSELCAHVKEVAKKEAGDAAAEAATEGCEKRFERAKEMKGLIKYREVANCVMDAQTLQAISDC